MSERVYDNRVCVLGGAFNPPTVAHVELLLAGMKCVNAERGLFLPANGAYVREKLADGDFAFSDSDRLNMLNSICEGDARLSVDERELKAAGRAYTYDTLKSIKRDMPCTDIYFIIGADKLHSLSRWYMSEELIREFHIIAAGRAGERNEIPEGITYMTLAKELRNVSASAFRALLAAGNTAQARDMVSPDIWEIVLKAYADLTSAGKTDRIQSI